jgi:lipoprotein NlpI
LVAKLKNYDKAIADYEAVIKLAPDNRGARFARGVHLLLRGDRRASDDFLYGLSNRICQGDNAAYGVLCGYLAARQFGTDADARRLLSDNDGRFDKAKRPWPIFQFLRGEMNEAELTKLASDVGKQTEVRCFLGFVHAQKGKKQDAIAHRRCVKDNGVLDYFEYPLAVGKLDQLERPEG